MTRFLILLMLPLLCCVSMAQVPAASSASAAASCLPSAEPTRDTACGACASGWRSGTGQQIHTEATPGLRVAADGYWWTCAMPEPPKPPPPPADCGVSGNPKAVTWKVGEHQCSGGNAVGIRHGEDHLYRQALGPVRGNVTHQCTNGQKVAVRATCEPAIACDMKWSLTEGDDTYVYDARPQDKRVPLGQYVRALAESGSGVRLQCKAGTLVLARQCEGPQTVSRGYTIERRYYRYDGLPVNVGAVVRAEQTHVISRAGVQSAGANRIRWTNATCTPSGRLQ